MPPIDCLTENSRNCLLISYEVITVYRWTLKMERLEWLTFGRNILVFGTVCPHSVHKLHILLFILLYLIFYLKIYKLNTVSIIIVINNVASNNKLFFLSVWFLSVLRGHSVFSSPPQRSMTSDFEGFLYQILSITLFSYLNSTERARIFPFQCWVLNKGTTGTIFITSLVWRGPWLGIEPGTSRPRSQHSTTRLSRRRWYI